MNFLNSMYMNAKTEATILKGDERGMELIQVILLILIVVIIAAGLWAWLGEWIGDLIDSIIARGDAIDGGDPGWGQ